MKLEKITKHGDAYKFCLRNGRKKLSGWLIQPIIQAKLGIVPDLYAVLEAAEQMPGWRKFSL